MRLIMRKYSILESLLIVSSPWTLLNSLKSLLTMTRSNMSQSKSTNKSKAKARSQPNLSKQDTICDGCCSAIIDNEQEAIQCEGCCQKWYHRLCAGVSKFHYDMLADSPDPFICWLCADSLRKAATRELQQELAELKIDFATELETNRSEIATLKEENATLRAALSQLKQQQLQKSSEGSSESLNSTATASAGSSWSKVQQSRSRMPRRPQREQNQSETTSRGSSAGESQRRINHPPTKNRVQVPGARKIWGTHPNATTQAVSKTIAALTEMSIASISIKRKYKMSPQSSGGGKLSRWWFVIRGDEEAMRQLEGKWNAVVMQVGWKLEPLYTFSDVVVTHQSSDDTVHN